MSDTACCCATAPTAVLLRAAPVAPATLRPYIGRLLLRLDSDALRSAQARRLQRLPAALLSPALRLTCLDLSDGILESLPADLGCSLPGLQQLKLSKNRLRELPESLGSLGTSLTLLDASFNQLATRFLGPWVGNLQSLTNLNLMKNSLTAVPPEIGNLTKLVSLGLKSNSLTLLPPNIGNLSELVHLFLTDNKLQSLPAELVGCISLRKVQAASNCFERLPKELAAMPALEFIRLSCCKLVEWPAVLRAPRLGWCSMAGNPIANSCVKVRSPPLPSVAASDTCLVEVLGPLGNVQGASGDVQRARYRGEAEEVVLKWFLVETAEGYVSPDGRPEDELAVACYAQHLQLVWPLAIVLATPGSDRAGLIMRRAKGRVLGTAHNFTSVLRPPKLWDGQRVSAPWIRRCFGDVACALGYLHSEHITMGDVFAHNILVTEEGCATLCDFGAAFFYDAAAGIDFERQEVRALGVLLQEVIERILDPAAPADESMRLGEVAKCCADDRPQMRPSFCELRGMLGA